MKLPTLTKLIVLAVVFACIVSLTLSLLINRPDPFMSRIRVQNERRPTMTNAEAFAIKQKSGSEDLIPRIIHQSWKIEPLPKRFELWSATWRRNHPTWSYNLWTDADNQRLVEQHFPWFLVHYEKLATMIQKADTARYLYMYKYGGLSTFAFLRARRLRRFGRGEHCPYRHSFERLLSGALFDG